MQSSPVVISSNRRRVESETAMIMNRFGVFFNKTQMGLINEHEIKKTHLFAKHSWEDCTALAFCFNGDISMCLYLL